jgi:hypothetical protein
MSTGAAKWVLVYLNEWTWLVVQYRVWLIVIVTAAGVVVPLMRAARKQVTPATVLAVRGGALALALSGAAVAICSLLHFSDLRWLPPGQRGGVHVSAPGGIFGFTRPAVGVLNSVADLPAEWAAAQLAVHTAVACAFLALVAGAAAALAWRRARRADIRQVVREEMRKAAGVARV